LKLIFCEDHFKLFRENGIIQILKENNKTEINIKKYGTHRPTTCTKEHCIKKGEYLIEYEKTPKHTGKVITYGERLKL